MSSLDTAIRDFAEFLNASWTQVEAISEKLRELDRGELLADWLQGNWEILVEARLRECAGFGHAFLEPYGEGADCNEKSSRVWLPGKTPTHRIICKPKAGDRLVDLLTATELAIGDPMPAVFDHLAKKSKDGWHEQNPWFDCALAYQGTREVLLSLDGITFESQPVDDTLAE